ncbi:GDP-mannose 4,6-dehydratase [Winogradskyella sp. HB-48]|uniref:GDP-mannose 4,6-dehydratase n=1 Tax=Winogradskyella sp. HB-48 TaxID=3416808 RepID=UPI003CF4EB67
MKKVLITGVTGMIGKHLAKSLNNNGYQVAGLSRATSASRYELKSNDYKHYKGDILDVKFLREVWSDWKPDLVYHLAAQAYNGESWRAEETTYQLNIKGSRNVFETCLELSPNARVIPACSSAEYGFVPDNMIPINEDKTPLQPITPYGVSKAAMEMMARQFHLNFGLDVVLPRLFIHVGPDHPPVTALQNFARQIASIKLGLQEPVMKVGNLSSSRDFVDVRDGVEALILLAEKGKSGEVYNLCYGKDWTMQESLDKLIAFSNMDIKVETDPKLFRPSDEKVLLGNPEKLNKLGWKAKIPFDTTLEDIYKNWLERLS